MIKACYGSSVFKNKTQVYETISIDMRNDGDKTFSAIVLVRCAEIQCFDHDDEDEYLLESSDWQYLKWDDYSPLMRQSVTRKINQHTAWLVNSFDVDDEPENSWLCSDFREALDIPFATDMLFENLSNLKSFEGFENTLQKSFGVAQKNRILNYFRNIFELPNKVEEERVMPSMKNDMPSYATWGDWS